MNTLEIKPADASHAPGLSALVNSDGPEYLRYFDPFPLTSAGFAEALQKAHKDRFWIICLDGHIAGFLMLRGYDQGYRIPSFGVYVCSRVSHQGLMQVALAFAIGHCRTSGLDRIRLSVHPNNTRAMAAYESAGFQYTGSESTKGHRIYEKTLKR